MQRVLRVSEDGVPPVHLLHNVWVHTVLLKGTQTHQIQPRSVDFEDCPVTSLCMFYLDVSYELQSWSFYGSLAVDDSLYGCRPSHGLVQHLGIETVGMLPPIHDDVPVT